MMSCRIANRTRATLVQGTTLGIAAGLLMLGSSVDARTVESSGANSAGSATATQQAGAAQQSNSASGFQQWVNNFRPYALSHGISAATFERAFRNARLQTSILNLSRSQPEFVRPVWEYLDTAVSDTRVSKGKQMLAQHRADFNRAQQRYGVPPEIIVAIWGMESNYGANFGNYPTIDALATIGYNGRREAWAKSELLEALKIIQNGDIDHDQMRGSWAGAMGNTQFMPSSFNSYAVDGDGDGRRDIWGSIPDVIASTANYLKANGWHAGEPWGVEVSLPQGFNYSLADGKQQRAVSAWQQLGVRATSGGALPSLEGAALLLPAGAKGPAFLVGHNFRTILRYNNSTSYALGVSLLAQRVAGQAGVQASWPRSQKPLSRTEIKQLQQQLTAMGYDAGGADGIVGPGTRDAVRQFQRAHGQPADGFISQEIKRQVDAAR
ncbi:lytic murein transglycosylase [Carnimonas nigrificans]|uniref:lytic murein transglycosylase n=1 Tax=Carnimonas nigrificans TaxID=64323 RepID=UPI0004716729|nr:lytic murein transglycosylase [Carnimonas nigrificans]